MDSGAVEPFISAAYVRRVGIKVHQLKAAKSVSLPDGSTVPVLGICHVKVKIQKLSGSVACSVVDLTEGFSLVFGETWLKQTHACLNFGNGFGNGTCRVAGV